MLRYNFTINQPTSNLPILRVWRSTVPAQIRPQLEHSHAAFEIAYFLSGKAVYSVGNKKYDIIPGSVVVFASNEQHCITEILTDDFEYIAMHFDPKYLWGGNDGLTEANYNFCFVHSRSFENLLSDNLPATDEIRKLILKIENEFKTKNSEYALMVKNYISEIAVNLIRNFNYTDNSDDISKKHIKSLKHAFNYIEKNISGVLTLDDIAAAAGMSPSYFCNVFKEINGITVWEYIVSKRCDMAAQMLLLEKDKNIIDIAEECGFNNSANFNKAFKKRIGITPSEYRLSGGII